MIDVANLSLIYLQKYVMANREDDVGKRGIINKSSFVLDIIFLLDTSPLPLVSSQSF